MTSTAPVSNDTPASTSSSTDTQPMNPDDALRALDDAQKTLDDNQAHLDDNQTTLDKQQSTLDQSKDTTQATQDQQNSAQETQDTAQNDQDEAQQEMDALWAKNPKDLTQADSDKIVALSKQAAGDSDASLQPDLATEATQTLENADATIAASNQGLTNEGLSADAGAQFDAAEQKSGGAQDGQLTQAEATDHLGIKPEDFQAIQKEPGASTDPSLITKAQYISWSAAKAFDSVDNAPGSISDQKLSKEEAAQVGVSSTVFDANAENGLLTKEKYLTLVANGTVAPPSGASTTTTNADNNDTFF